MLPYDNAFFLFGEAQGAYLLSLKEKIYSWGVVESHSAYLEFNPYSSKPRIYSLSYPILCPQNECTRVVMAPGTLLAMAK